MAVGRARVIGVVGARGGVGASTIAAALAHRWARSCSTVLVDANPGGSGIDVLVGIEALPGIRWPDLAAASGDIPVDDIAVLLPRWSGCAVLSMDRARPGAPPVPVMAAVLAALTGGYECVVVDIGKAALSCGLLPALDCAAVVVVSPTDMAGIAGALAVRDLVAAGLVDRGAAGRGAALHGVGRAAADGRAVRPSEALVLVTRPSPAARVAPSEVAGALGVPWLAHLRDDRSVARAIEHGVGPVRLTGRTARCMRRIAAGLP